MSVSRGWLAAVLVLAAAGARAEVVDALAPPPRPAELRVPLELRAAPEAELLPGTPVTTGVPFAEGWLASPAGLRVETDAGAAVPAQLSPRGTWPRTDGVRWLGVDFTLVPGARAYTLVATREPAPAPESAVAIQETPDAFMVSTGALRAEIPRRGGLLRRAWWRDALVLEQEESNWLSQLADGRRMGDRGDPETRAVVEQSGPLHAVIRVDGRYRGRPGDPTPRWSARLHFHAGRPTIGITHTFTWVGTADALQVRELALGFRLARPMTRAALDESNRPDAGAVEASLRDGRQLAVVQESHFQWGHGESRFRVLSGPADRPEVVASGERAGAWVDASDGSAGVALVLRDLWKQHPKELRATSDGLTAFLWSGSGASPPLDLRFPALERMVGAPLLEQLQAPKLRAQWEKFRDPRWHDPTGFARTHDLQLLFHDGDFRAGGVPAAADAFDRPPLLLPAPGWTAASGVVGRIAARDEGGFPELEARFGQVWDDVLALVDDFGDYGFFGHGSGPHHAYEIVGGRAIAVPWRFTGGVEYGFARAAWLAWLRSGERSYFELAAAHTRYLNDLILCHEDSTSRRKGDWFWSSGVALIPWGGAYSEAASRREDEDEQTPALGVLASFGFFIEHALLHWYQTGDARSLDVAKEYAAALKEGIQSRPGWAERFVAEMNAQKSRHAFQRLEDLAVLWEQLDDPWFREEADRLARLLLPPAEPAGLRRDPASPRGTPLAHPYAVFYKAPNVLRYAQAVDGPARQAALEALRRSAEWALRVQDGETRSLGLRMGTAYALTGDPLFLAHASRGLGRREAGLERDATGKRGYRIKLGGVTAHAYNTLTNEAALIAALRGAPPLPAPFPAAWKGAGLPAATLALRKEGGRELRAQLTASATAALADPRGRPWPADWTTAQREYGREGVGPLVWREVRIPASAPAGEYRVELPRESAAWLLAADAPGVALVAPGGFQLGGEPDPPWYFEVPEGTRALRLRASDPDLIELRDARGEPAKTRPADGDAFEVEVDDEGDGGVWSVRGSRPFSLALEGVAPIFAFGARERLFAAALPAGADAARAAASSDEGFPPGRHGLGLRVSGRDALVLSPGARQADGRFERFDAREGTLEFFVRPDWDSTLLPYRTTKGLFAIDGEDGSLHAYYVHALDSSGEPIWDLVFQAAPPGAPQEMFRAQRGSPMRWRQDAFVHVALVWYPTRDGQRWALWVNGVRTSTQQGGGRAWTSFVPREPTAIRVGASGPWKEAGAIDGVIDELRLSSQARYKPGEKEKASVFTPPETLAADAATLALFDFEGDTRGTSANGAAVEAELRRDATPPQKPRRERKPRPAQPDAD